MKRIIAALLLLGMLGALLVSCGDKTDVTYKILDENFGEEYYAVGFRLGDNALTLKVQSILDEMAADGASAEISKKWFGTDAVVKDKDFPRAIDQTPDDDSLQYILDKGTLIIGLDDNYPPMGYRENGEIVGFDIDLAKEVCKRLGVEAVFQPISWSAKEMELSSKSIDCIWNGMSITEARAAEMNLTKPYLENAQIILVSSEAGITSKAALSGKKVGTQQGSAALDAINEDPDFKASFAECAEYSDYNSAYLDLKAGRIDAIVGDKTYIEYILAHQD